MIKLVTSDDVLRSTRISLGIASSSAVDNVVDDALLAGLLRRLAGVRCPCSPTTLVSEMKECLTSLLPELSPIDRIEEVIEALVANGDLLELSAVTSVDQTLPSTAVFVAPPSFVFLASDMVLLFGMAEEESLPLPDRLRNRVKNVGTRRLIHREAGEDLRSDLLAHGYREQTLEGWNRQPRTSTAREYVERRNRQLNAQSTRGDITGLVIYDDTTGAINYAGRWMEPKGHSGRYVGRRPQAHGAHLWCYVELDNGTTTHLLDFPLPGEPYRACDAAWCLMSALAHEAGRPHTYTTRRAGDTAEVDLYFPIPMWVQRRLGLVGTRAERHNSLMTFQLPSDCLERETSFLESSLWLRRSHS